MSGTLATSKTMPSNTKAEYISDVSVFAAFNSEGVKHLHVAGWTRIREPERLRLHNSLVEEYIGTKNYSTYEEDGALIYRIER